MTGKRSNEEVKKNGRKKTKLKNAYCYKDEWYLECGNRYNDHGDVHDESEVAYKMMYEALKKRQFMVTFSVIRSRTKTSWSLVVILI